MGFGSRFQNPFDQRPVNPGSGRGGWGGGVLLKGQRSSCVAVGGRTGGVGHRVGVCGTLYRCVPGEYIHVVTNQPINVHSCD